MLGSQTILALHRAQDESSFRQVGAGFSRHTPEFLKGPGSARTRGLKPPPRFILRRKTNFRSHKRVPASAGTRGNS